MAQLALGALDQVEDVEPEEVGRVVLDGYLEGLRETGWRGDWTEGASIEEVIAQRAKQARFVLESAREAYELVGSTV